MIAIELFAAVITVLSIWLATRENVWYYPVGIVSVVLYAWIFVQARLYAEAGLQVVWLVLMIYGWYKWLYGGADRTELPVSRATVRGWMIVVATGVGGTALILSVQLRWTDNAAPLVDSAIAAWSIAAQWMTARKWIENWVVWAAINIVAVPLYVTRQLWITAVLYTVLLLLAMIGYRTWKESLESA